MSDSSSKDSEDTQTPPKNLSETASSGQESHDSGQNPSEPRRHSSNYPSSAQTNSDSKSRNSASEERSPTGSESTVVLLLGIAADTTWRMFVPIVGAALLGVWADHLFDMKPWMTVAGIVIGITIAALLIRQQLQLSGKTK